MTRRGIPTTDHDVFVPTDLYTDEFLREFGDRLIKTALDAIHPRRSNPPAPRMFDFLLTVERSRPFVLHYEAWSPYRPFIDAFSKEFERFSDGEWTPAQRLEVLGRRFPPVTAVGIMVPYRAVMRDSGPLCSPLLEREMHFTLPLGASELLAALGLAVNDRRMRFDVGSLQHLTRSDREIIESLAFARRGLVTGELLTRVEVDSGDPSVWRLPPSRFEM
jgi:hypothetical protein